MTLPHFDVILCRINSNLDQNEQNEDGEQKKMKQGQGKEDIDDLDSDDDYDDNDLSDVEDEDDEDFDCDLGPKTQNKSDALPDVSRIKVKE